MFIDDHLSDDQTGMRNPITLVMLKVAL